METTIGISNAWLSFISIFLDPYRARSHEARSVRGREELLENNSKESLLRGP